MYTFAERWLEGALFLSLELTRPFFQDLWVPIKDAVKFQTDLRVVLKDSVNEESYYSEREALGYGVIEWFHSTYGPHEFEVFSSWIGKILVVQGPDRPGETFWSALSSEMVRQFESNSPMPEWIGRLMTTVASFERLRMSQFEEKMEAAEDYELDPWDAHVLAVKDSLLDAVMIKISLVVTYNIFFANWERHGTTLTYPELYELWVLGKKMMPDFGMEASDLVFPGVWRFELHERIRNFAQTFLD